MISDRDLYEAYYQKGSEYYIQRLERFESGRRFFFHTYSAVFGLSWFLYRKLYLPAIIFFLLGMCVILVPSATGWLDENFPTGLYPHSLSIQRICIIMLAFTVPFIADYIYIVKAKKEVRIAMQRFKNREDMIAYLTQRGGSSMKGPAIFIGCYLLLLLCLHMFISYQLKQ